MNNKKYNLSWLVRAEKDFPINNYQCTAGTELTVALKSGNDKSAKLNSGLSTVILPKLLALATEPSG